MQTYMQAEHSYLKKYIKPQDNNTTKRLSIVNMSCEGCPYRGKFISYRDISYKNVKIAMNHVRGYKQYSLSSFLALNMQAISQEDPFMVKGIS